MKSKEKIMEELNISKLPKNWTDGEIRYNSSKDKEWRYFINLKDEIVILYDEENDGVLINKIIWEENTKNWKYSKDLYETRKEKTDKEKFEKSIELMKKYNKGELKNKII
ncbi:MAG: hypothetical protein ACOCP8_03845 [archaeon]